MAFPSNSFVEPMRELSLLRRLDRRRLTNLTNLEDQFQTPEWDPKLEWCVPYMQSATGILYSKRVAEPPVAWADLWSNRYARRMTMLDDPAEVFGAASSCLGNRLMRPSRRR